jgi:hypothetical protein
MRVRLEVMFSSAHSAACAGAQGRGPDVASYRGDPGRRGVHAAERRDWQPTWLFASSAPREVSARAAKALLVRNSLSRPTQSTRLLRRSGREDKPPSLSEPPLSGGGPTHGTWKHAALNALR